MTRIDESSNTLPKCVLRNGTSSPSKLAMRRKTLGIWQPITWGQVLTEVRNIGAGLLADELATDPCIVVLGHVCDREGKKESKSKGNYTPPEVILDKVRMEFAVVSAATVKGLEATGGEAYIAREDYEGLDLTGESSVLAVYREDCAPRRCN